MVSTHISINALELSVVDVIVCGKADRSGPSDKVAELCTLGLVEYSCDEVLESNENGPGFYHKGCLDALGR